LPYMHEKPYHQASFDYRDRHGRHEVECAEFQFRDSHGSRRQGDQGDKDEYVIFDGNDAMTHRVCPIRYRSGNKKIHTISTKCQYRPIISTGVYQAALNRFLMAMTTNVKSSPAPTIMCSACIPVMAK